MCQLIEIFPHSGMYGPVAAGHRQTGLYHLPLPQKYEKRIPQARENFARAGRERDITLLEGDAADILKGLDGEYPHTAVLACGIAPISV